jgi:predicted peptidase
MIVSILSLGILLFVTGCVMSQRQHPRTLTGQYARSFKTEIKKTLHLEYWLYLPEEYAASKTDWPLVLFLHGAGERGSDLEKVKIHGLPKLVAEGREFPFVIISPQCPEDAWWTSELQMDALNALLDEIVSRYRIDADRLYLTGLSMGGYGTWSLAVKYPHRFAAIAPVCGGGKPGKAHKIAHLPVWVFHGAKDKTVPIRLSREMVDALKKAGGNVKFTIYPEAAHDSWTETYNNPELYQWFLTKKKDMGEEKNSTTNRRQP